LLIQEIFQAPKKISKNFEHSLRSQVYIFEDSSASCRFHVRVNSSYWQPDYGQAW